MFKRIAAAFLVLVVLVAVLPAEVYAAVYDIGDHLWVVGANNVPAEETVEGGEWAPYTGDDDIWDYRTGTCPETAHKHGTSCYDTANNLVCKLNEHEHNIICGLKYTEYDWWVVPSASVPDETLPDESIPDESIPDESLPDESLPDEPDPGETVPGAASFTVRNIDTKGNPLVGAEFYLLEPREGENAVVQANDVTNENGEILFANIYLEEGVSSATWQLAQNMPPENDLSNYYRPNTDKWNVNIVRNADGTHSLDIVLPTESEEETEETEASAEETVYKQGFDAQTGILTVINEPLLGSLLVNVRFEGLANDAVPDDMTLLLTVTGPDGYEEIVSFPVDRVGYSPWQAELESLALGEYSITNVEAAQVEGYNLEASVIAVELPGEDPVTSSSITLNKNDAYATFTITNRYAAVEQKETTEPEEESVSNTIIVKSVDDLGEAISGAAFALINKKTSETLLTLADDSEFVLSLEGYAVEGQTLSLALQQTRAPAGYELSSDSYTIEIKMDNGEPKVTLTKDGNILTTLFGRNSIELGTNGEQIAIFTNVRKTTQIELELDVAVDFMKGSWKDKSLMREYQDEEYSFLLTWEDDGVERQETMTLEHGESKTFKAVLPYGAEYKVTAVNEDGYYYTYFSGTNDGAVEVTQLKENIQLTATNEYVIEAGDELDLYMEKVDSSTKEPLEGAKFILKDADGDELKTYKTDETGEIDIVNLLDTPGTYTLTETKAPDEYDKLTQAISIVVSAEYDLKKSSTRPVLEQTMTAEISHRYVTLQSDGTYQIVNTLSTDNPKTGDGSNIHIWTWGMVASSVGLAAVVIEMSKKRKAQ